MGFLLYLFLFEDWFRDLLRFLLLLRTPSLCRSSLPVVPPAVTWSSAAKSIVFPPARGFDAAVFSAVSQSFSSVFLLSTELDRLTELFTDLSSSDFVLLLSTFGSDIDTSGTCNCCLELSTPSNPCLLFRSSFDFPPLDFLVILELLTDPSVLRRCFLRLLPEAVIKHSISLSTRKTTWNIGSLQLELCPLTW